jgi:hypothetical protein
VRPNNGNPPGFLPRPKHGAAEFIGRDRRKIPAWKSCKCNTPQALQAAILRYAAFFAWEPVFMRRSNTTRNALPYVDRRQ